MVMCCRFSLLFTHRSFNKQGESMYPYIITIVIGVIVLFCSLAVKGRATHIFELIGGALIAASLFLWFAKAIDPLVKKKEMQSTEQKEKQ